MLESNEWLNTHEWRALEWITLQAEWMAWPLVGAVACAGLVLIPLWFAGRVDLERGTG